jgi:hypothetical protein
MRPTISTPLASTLCSTRSLLSASIRFWLPVALLAASLACAGNHHDRYRRQHPDWDGRFPRTGAALDETLAGLQAPSGSDARRSLSKLVVLRVGEAGASELAGEALEAVLAAPPGGVTFGVVATVDCRYSVELESLYGQKVAWMLLEGGRLTAWDVPTFEHRCTVGSDFRPATQESAVLESRVIEVRDRSFPRSMGHPLESYAKGLAYLGEGRVDAAQRMLDAGDATFDVSRAGSTASGRPSGRAATSGNAETAAMRVRLVDAIAARVAASER